MDPAPETVLLSSFHSILRIEDDSVPEWTQEQHHVASSPLTHNLFLGVEEVLPYKFIRVNGEYRHPWAYLNLTEKKWAQTLSRYTRPKKEPSIWIPKMGAQQC